VFRNTFPSMVDLHLVSAPAEMAKSKGSTAVDVLLAVRHPLLSSSLRQLLDAEQDIEVIGEADDLGATLRGLDAELPHVLVVDLGMLGGSAGETIGKLRARAPESQVVLLTMDDSPLVAQHLLGCGARGFVLKDRADDELACAVRAAARGGEYLSPGVARRLDRALRRSVVPA